MTFPNPIVMTYPATIEDKDISAILERKLKVLDSLGKAESEFRFPSATPYSNQMKTKPAKKPNYRQLVKRVEGLSNENQTLQNYLKVSREFEQQQFNACKKHELALQVECNKTHELERTVNNLRQVIQNLAAAAVKTNEALGRM